MQARSWEISFSFQLSWCIYLFLCCRLVFRLLASCVENERKRLFFFPVWWLVCVHIPSPPLFFWEIRGIGSPLLSWLSPILSSTDVVFFFIRKRELIYTERTHTHTKHIRGKEMRARMWRPSDPHVPDVASQPSQAYPGNSSGERERDEHQPAVGQKRRKQPSISSSSSSSSEERERRQQQTAGGKKDTPMRERKIMTLLSSSSPLANLYVLVTDMSPRKDDTGGGPTWGNPATAMWYSITCCCSRSLNEVIRRLVFRSKKESCVSERRRWFPGEEEFHLDVGAV